LVFSTFAFLGFLQFERNSVIRQKVFKYRDSSFNFITLVAVHESFYKTWLLLNISDLCLLESRLLTSSTAVAHDLCGADTQLSLLALSSMRVSLLKNIDGLTFLTDSPVV